MGSGEWGALIAEDGGWYVMFLPTAVVAAFGVDFDFCLLCSCTTEAHVRTQAPAGNTSIQLVPEPVNRLTSHAQVTGGNGETAYCKAGKLCEG